MNAHLRCAPALAAGPATLPRLLPETTPDPDAAALPRLTTAFATTQAAWRFYGNDAVSLPTLAAPLGEAGRCALATSRADFALVIHDWSSVNYHRHTGNADQILFRQGSDRGYELASALLVDAATGDPLAPLELRLRTADAVSSTRQPAPRRTANHLDEVAPTMRAMRPWGRPRTVVHLIDCEGDSVAHLRRWQKQDEYFLIRTAGTRTVRWRAGECRMPAVVAALEQARAFGAARAVQYHGQTAVQTVAETTVVLTRPAYRNRKGKRRVIPGKPLTLRLVVSQVRDAAGALLAQWCLLTNLPPEVEATQVALWYDWRWRIESYFKLRKSAGQPLEAWPQESGAALAKRLLVASMAGGVVWHLARLPGPEGESLRELLIRLSGRQMKWGVADTLPALLAGLWVLVAATTVLQHYDSQAIETLLATVLPSFAKTDNNAPQRSDSS